MSHSTVQVLTWISPRSIYSIFIVNNLYKTYSPRTVCKKSSLVSNTHFWWSTFNEFSTVYCILVMANWVCLHLSSLNDTFPSFHLKYRDILTFIFSFCFFCSSSCMLFFNIYINIYKHIFMYYKICIKLPIVQKIFKNS